MLSVTFGAFVLKGIYDWEEVHPSRVARGSYGRRHGAKRQRVAFKDILTVRLLGEAQEANEAALKTYLEDLSRTLHELGEDKLTLYDDGRYYNAIKSGFSKGRAADRAPALVSRYVIEFQCNDPFLYAAAESASATQSVVASPHTFVVVNNGGFRTPARVEITPSSGQPDKQGDFVVENGANAFNWKLSGTLKAGHTLVVRKEPSKVVTNGGAIAYDNFTGTFWDVERGNNNIKYVGPTGVDLKVYWHERWS